MKSELDVRLDAIEIARAHMHRDSHTASTLLSEYKKKRDIQALTVEALGLVSLLLGTLVPDPDAYLNGLIERFREAGGLS
jgi:hypothetical protein